MTCEFNITRRVEFHETDLAGIVHFSNFFRYMEATEHAFFRSLNLHVHESTDGVMVGFARVHAACDYKHPLRYPDEFDIRLRIAALGNKSITYSFCFSHQAETVAEGSMKVVCVQRAADGADMRSVELPSEVREKLTVASSSSDGTGGEGN